MGTASNRSALRKEARGRIDSFFQNSSTALTVHYSCESFYDLAEPRSPRITSIAVRHHGSTQITSFSIHLVAERKRIQTVEIAARYDELEKLMLSEFFEYAMRRQNHTWLHWNMRDSNFGFPALIHRFSVLGGKSGQVTEFDQLNLANTLTELYGHDYMPHRRMERTIELNGITMRDFLSGADEAKAFEKHDYVNLHRSTLRKVEAITSIAERAWLDTLKTQASRRHIYGTTVAGWVENVLESPLGRAISAFGIVLGVIGLPVTAWGLIDRPLG